MVSLINTANHMWIYFVNSSGLVLLTIYFIKLLIELSSRITDVEVANLPMDLSKPIIDRLSFYLFNLIGSNMDIYILRPIFMLVISKINSNVYLLLFTFILRINKFRTFIRWRNRLFSFKSCRYKMRVKFCMELVLYEIFRGKIDLNLWKNKDEV